MAPRTLCSAMASCGGTRPDDPLEDPSYGPSRTPAELPPPVPVISGWPADVPYSSDDVTDSPFDDLRLLPATDNAAVSAGGLLSMAPSGRLGCYGSQAKTVTHRGCEQERESDRKSTRLNSSHVAISYAVFCLKKKTRT